MEQYMNIKNKDESNREMMSSSRMNDTILTHDILLNSQNRGRNRDNNSNYDKESDYQYDRSQQEILHELSKMENQDEIMEDDKVKYLVSEEIKEVTPYDFGYYTLFHTGNENLDKEIKNGNRDDRSEDNEQKYYVNGNFLDYLNKSKNENAVETYLHFAKYKDTYTKKLSIANPFLIRQKRNNKIKEFSTKKMTQNQSMKPDDENEDLIKNTINSMIYIGQKEEINKGKYDEAIKMNFEYVVRKAKYECDLIQLQLDKYQDYLNSSGKKKVKITHPSPFIDLKRNSLNLLKDFNNFILGQSMNNRMVRSRLEQYSMQSRSCLVDFMGGIVRYYEKYLIEKRATNDKSQNYIKWKSKLSQLVGIWDLANSNGTEIRVPWKYSILKRFFSMRALARQEDKEYIIIPREEKKSVVQEGFIFNLFCSDNRNVNIHPIFVFLHEDRSRAIMEVVVAILLFYSFFIVPYTLFLGNETNFLKIVEKFVDAYFYIDIMIYFRTSYKDKFNEDIYDVRQIAIKYFFGFFLVDFSTTIPWYFFFISVSSIQSTIKMITHVAKIARILKLLPILNRLEQLKAANYFRLIKLLVIYFLMMHWMACVIIYGLDTTMLYDLQEASCYSSNISKNKFTMSYGCQYIFSTYQAAYMIPGGYTSYMDVYGHLSKSSEYLVLIFEYLIGQFISAYTFGAITSILQNLNQGSNFLTAKTDLLREHMLFYDIDIEVQNDVTVYYDYLWQRHKDMIYGKHHFDLLSKSLREKFENFNMVGSEVYLYTFFKLNNSKLLGFVLRDLRKRIVFPYEILYEEGSLIPGLYILTNGDLIFTTVQIENAGQSAKSVDYTTVIKELEKRNTWKDKKYEELAKDMCVIFPLVSAFIKTGRTYQRCFATDFTDLLYLPLIAFDDMIISFPVEMHSLKHEVMHEVERTKLFENLEIFKTLSLHSARSIGKNYEKEYSKLSIWIPIPIPISQRKIATSYIESFVKKIKNQWREILINSDMNICLGSIMIMGFLRSGDKKKDNINDNNEKNVLIQQGDQLDVMKNITKALFALAGEFQEVQPKEEIESIEL